MADVRNRYSAQDLSIQRSYCPSGYGYSITE